MPEIRKRSEIESKYKWDLTHIFSSDDEFDKELNRVAAMVEQYAEYEGHTAERPREAIRSYFDICEALSPLGHYAMLKKEADSGDSLAQAQYDRIMSLEVKASAAMSFLTPELLAMDDADLQKIADDPEMADYDVFIRDLIREKPHTLPPEQEKLLAMMGEIQQGPENIFSMLTSMDMKFPDIDMPDGSKGQLSNGNYGIYLHDEDRNIRKQAFENMHDTYGRFGATIATTYATSVKSDCFNANVRRYASARAAAMEPLQIPESVYDSLIEAVHEALPSLQKYLQLRKKTLSLDELHMYDLYCPMVKDYTMEIPYEKAYELVLDGLKPLGEDYVEKLREARDGGWIDVYPSENKTGGAFSAGGMRDVHPYVLLNQVDNLDSVFTIAHELGHSMHSFFSNTKQPAAKSNYSLFVAEVASTCNETILLRSLLKAFPEKKAQAYLLNYFLEQVRTTVFRQTMFAEFEKIVHEMSEKGEPLTRETMTKVYMDLNRLYYGETCVVDELIGNEWLRIPHFYSAFYVYVYATGLCAAISLADRILGGDPSAVEDYRRFLSAGCSVSPLEALKLAGIDMSSPEPVRAALRSFAEKIAQLEAALD